MSLQHKINQVSIGADGKSVVLADVTPDYGLEGNPARDTLAWCVAVSHHDGQSAAPVTNLDFLTNPSGAEPPVYEASDATAGTFLHIALPEDGVYTVTSVLVPRLSTLAADAGNLALNLLYYDEQTQAIRRVTGTAQVLEAGEWTGYWTYTLTDVAGVAVAVAEGYPAVEYPVLSLYEAYRLSDRANLAYLEAPQQPTCATRGAATCTGGSDQHAQRRDLYFKLVYALEGAEGSFRNGYEERVRQTLVRVRQISDMIQEGN
jgi:hypothetical protein